MVPSLLPDGVDADSDLSAPCSQERGLYGRKNAYRRNEKPLRILIPAIPREEEKKRKLCLSWLLRSSFNSTPPGPEWF